MNKIDKLIKTGLYLLLGWYFISLYIVFIDTTLDLGIKIAGEIINYLMIIMLIRVIKWEYRMPAFTDLSVISMMIIWFFFSTIRDYNDPGYGFLLKMFYLAIDLLSTAFCIDTFINFLLNSNIIIVGKEEIERINNILNIGICVVFSFLYFNFYRHLK